MALSTANLKKPGRWLLWLICLGLFATLVATVVLGRQVFSDLEQQRSASSDNVQWTLTQVEVEYLSFLNALEHLGHEKDAENPPAGLPDVRRDFDIFYSRVDTLKSASLFNNLRMVP